MKKLTQLILILLVLAPCRAELKPEDYKPVLVGRKDLIRNEAINSVTNLCKYMIDSNNIKMTSLDKSLHICLDELRECNRQLKEASKG